MNGRAKLAVAMIVAMAASATAAFGLSRRPRMFLAPSFSTAIRRAALAKIIQHPRIGDKEAVQALLGDRDKELRRSALAFLIEQYPDLINDKTVMPDLIEILREPEPTSKLTTQQVRAGFTIARLAKKDFDFGSPGRCGTPLFEYSEMIRRGKQVGGEAGQALVARGEKGLSDFKVEGETMEKEFQAKALSQRLRVLKWWNESGRTEFGG